MLRLVLEAKREDSFDLKSMSSQNRSEGRRRVLTNIQRLIHPLPEDYLYSPKRIWKENNRKRERSASTKDSSICKAETCSSRTYSCESWIWGQHSSYHQEIGRNKSRHSERQRNHISAVERGRNELFEGKEEKVV